MNTLPLLSESPLLLHLSPKHLSLRSLLRRCPAQGLRAALGTPPPSVLTCVEQRAHRAGVQLPSALPAHWGPKAVTTQGWPDTWRTAGTQETCAHGNPSLITQIKRCNWEYRESKERSTPASPVLAQRAGKDRVLQLKIGRSAFKNTTLGVWNE